MTFYIYVHRMNMNVLEHRTVEMSSLDGQLVGITKCGYEVLSGYAVGFECKQTVCNQIR